VDWLQWYDDYGTSCRTSPPTV